MVRVVAVRAKIYFEVKTFWESKFFKNFRDFLFVYLEW